MGVHRTKLVGNPIPAHPSEVASIVALQQRLMDHSHGGGEITMNKSVSLPSLFSGAVHNGFRSIPAMERTEWPTPSTQTSFQSLEALIQRTTGGMASGNASNEERYELWECCPLSKRCRRRLRPGRGCATS